MPQRPKNLGIVEMAALERTCGHAGLEKRQAMIRAVILHRGKGLTMSEAAQKLGVSRRTVATWVHKYDIKGIYGLWPSKRRRKGVIHTEDEVRELCRAMSHWYKPSIANVRDWLNEKTGRIVSLGCARYWRKKALVRLSGRSTA
jgi:transposase